MSWLKRKAKDVIPNPRDNKRKQDAFERAQVNTLIVLQMFVFALLFLMLEYVAYAPV